MRMRAAIVPSLALLALPALAGCSLFGPTSVQEFAVGECVNLTADVTEESTEVGELPVVDCAEAHDAEVFHVTDTSLTEFDEDAITTEADLACYDAFEGYVGIAYEESSIYYTLLYPTQESWDIDDRAIVCLLLGAEQLTGSLEGAGI